MSQFRTDVAVIGGGPGGYVAALRAAKRGATVTLVEERELGGVCLNRGCIPTKTLLRSAEVLSTVRRAAEFGVVVQGGVSVDYSRMFQRKETVVRQLRKGVEGLLKAAKVSVVRGRASLKEAHAIKVVGADGSEEIITAKSIILATGSSPAMLPIAAPGATLMSSDDVLAMDQLPDSLAVIGGGVIGVEFASLMARLGVKVYILEMMPQILPGEDTDTAEALKRALARDGVAVYTLAKVKTVRPVGGRLSVEGEVEGRPFGVTAEKVLVAVGRRPNTTGLGLENANVALTERGFVKVDAHMETTAPGVYAIGDIVGRWQLAHVASAQGIVAADNATGYPRTMDYAAVPRCIYTTPEVASVGLTEAQARAQGLDFGVSSFPFAASGKALALGEREGFVKMIYGRRYQEVLGVHIVGPHATELIAEAVMAMTTECTVEEIADAIHAHPTLSEATAEAAHVAMGLAIHIP